MLHNNNFSSTLSVAGSTVMWSAGFTECIVGGKCNTSRSAVRWTGKEINWMGPSLQLTVAGWEFWRPGLEASMQDSDAPKARQLEVRWAGISVVWAALSEEGLKSVLLTTCLIGNVGWSFSLGYGISSKLVHLCISPIPRSKQAKGRNFTAQLHFESLPNSSVN